MPTPLQTTDPATGGPRLGALEIAGVLGALCWVEWSAARLPVRDVPLGIDWQRYLGNALAIAQDDWPSYQVWRGPLHPFACLLLTPVAGHLLEASQLVSMLAVAALVVGSAALARRALGPGAGLATAVALAAWPDLALQARMSTPYPLLAGLLTVGLYVLDRVFHGPDGGQASSSTGSRWLEAAAAGVLFGLAGAADVRGLVLASGALAGGALAGGAFAGVAEPAGTRHGRRWLALFAVLAVALLTRELIVGRLPVQLLSLGEQVALQRDLHAREAGIQACTDKRAAAVVITDLWSACGRETAWRNLGRLSGMAPLPWGLLAVLGALGVRRRTLPLLGACVTLLPAVFVVGIEHRYLLPLAGAVTILVVAGAMRLGGFLVAAGRARRQGSAGAGSGAGAAAGVGLRGEGLVAAAVVSVALAVGWRLHASTLMDRATGALAQPAAHAQAVRFDALPPIAVARRVIRERAPASAHVVDCAGLSLDERIYPVPVEEAAFNGRSSARCRRLLSRAAPPGVWVLARGEADPSWTAEVMAGADLRVLHAR